MRKYFLAALLRLRVNADTLYLIDLNIHNLMYLTHTDIYMDILILFKKQVLYNQSITVYCFDNQP